MLKTMIISLFLSISFASASEEIEVKEEPTHKRTAIDLTAMLIGTLGSKVLGIDQNLIDANVELSELQEDMKRLNKNAIAARNARIEAEMNHYDSVLRQKRTNIVEVERYRKGAKIKTNALRTLGLAAALDFFIFDNTLPNTKLLSETKPSTVSADDPVPTLTKAEK